MQLHYFGRSLKKNLIVLMPPNWMLKLSFSRSADDELSQQTTVKASLIVLYISNKAVYHSLPANNIRDLTLFRS